MDLTKGKTRMNTLIIGAGSDIGKAVALRLYQEDHITGTYYQSSEAVKDLCGDFFQCDLRDLVQIDQVIQDVPNLDLIVTAAFPFIESSNFDYESYQKVEEILRGHVYLLCQLRNKMRADCRIINILGQCVERGIPEAAFYSAAFAFLHNWGHGINSKEGKEGKVSICDLLLGPVDTREWAGLSMETLQKYRSKVKQFISTKTVADALYHISRMPVMPSTYVLDAYYGY